MKKFFAAFLGIILLCGIYLTQSDIPLNAIAETESAINVYSTSSSLIAPPAVIMEYNDGDDVSVFEGSVQSKLVRPSTMIVEVDEDFNLSCGGEEVDYDTFRKKYIKSKMLPTVRVESEGAASALIDYLSTREYDFIDFSVVSTSAVFVKKVRMARPNIRGIIDYSNTDVSAKTAGQIANEMNANMALTAIFDYSQVDAEKVFGIQGRFKSVWVKQTVESKHDVLSAVATGAVGIVSDNYTDIYNAYLSVRDSTLSRGFYGIGHRGLPSAAGENTLEGMIAAYQAGATHFEIDAKVCKSGEIVLMHDDGIATTTNGTGNIYNMTLTELRQYQVVKNSDGTAVTPSQIPTLDEVFEYFKGKDVVIVVETKNTQSIYPEKLAQLIKKHDIADQVVVIGFGTSELALVRDQVSEIPTANLNGTNKSDFLTYMAKINALNTSLDVGKSGFITDSWMFKNSFARGYLPYSWTFSTKNDTEGAVARGCMGITTDCVDVLGGYAQKVLTKSVEAYDLDSTNQTYKIEVETYAGDKEIRNAKVASYVKTGEKTALAIFAYEDNGYYRLTEEIPLTLTEKQQESTSGSSQTPGEGNSQESGILGESNSGGLTSGSQSESGIEKGCKSSVNAITLAGVFALSFFAVALIRKMKESN